MAYSLIWTSHRSLLYSAAMKILILMIAVGITSLNIQAEDWATSDGRIYKDVKIGSHDAANVTILDSDGGTTIPIVNLPTDIQKKLDYDPVKAAALLKVQEEKRKKDWQEFEVIRQKQLSELRKLIAEALADSPNKTVLYSLEPEDRTSTKDKTLHNYKILGQTEINLSQTTQVAGIFQKSAEDWNGMMAMCFNPRHALRITSKGHVYDFLICFECQGLEFYKDDKSIGETGVTGSPDILNGLLTAAQIPLAKNDEGSPEEEAAEEKKQKDEEDRWFAGMPKSIQASWNWREINSSPIPDVSLFRGLIIREYPDVPSRILKLLEWNGSGAGPWTGFPSYEEAPDLLLFDYSTPVILNAIQSTKPSDAQIEGAARFFGGWNFSQKRPKDRATLPPDLRKTLLAHCLKSKDTDKIERAKSAFQ